MRGGIVLAKAATAVATRAQDVKGQDGRRHHHHLHHRILPPHFASIAHTHTTYIRKGMVDTHTHIHKTPDTHTETSLDDWKEQKNMALSNDDAREK